MKVWVVGTLVGVVLLGLFLALPTSAGVNELQDRQQVPSWAVEAVDVLMEEGLIHGYPDGTFRPDRPISRAEMALVVAGLLTKLRQEKLDPGTRALIGALREEFAGELESLRQALAEQRSAISEVREAAYEASAQAEENSRLIDQLSKELARLAWSGDFRYRVELNDEQLRDRDDQRQRIRLRIGTGIGINPNTRVNFRFTTGREDPLSGNQTLGNFNAGFDFRLDYANLHWTRNLASGSRLEIYAGSFPSGVLHKNTQIVFDNEMTFQGLMEKLVFPAGRGELGLSLVQNLIRDVGDTFGEDGWLYGVQLASDDVLAEGLDLFAGYYTLTKPELMEGIKDEFFRLVDFNGDGSVTRKDLLPGEVPGLGDYTILSLGASYTFGDPERPVKIYGDYVRNLDASFPAEGATGAAAFLEDQDEWGFDLGVKVGRLKKPGDWQALAEWRRIGAFATFPWLGDSDFKATNIHGLKLSLGYQYSPNVVFKYSGFLGQVDNRFGVLEEAVRRNRHQFDVIFKF